MKINGIISASCDLLHIFLLTSICKILHFLIKNLPSPGASPSLVVIPFLHVLQPLNLMQEDLRGLVLDHVEVPKVVHLGPGVARQVPQYPWWLQGS